MSRVISKRAAATRLALLEAALEEFSAFGFRRTSMESVARRAGVSRATLYLYWKSKDALFRDLVEQTHEDQVAAMELVYAEEPGDFEHRLLAMLEARFLRFIELTSASPHAAELFDLHGRLCGDVALASQEKSEKLIAKLVRNAVASGEADLSAAGLSPARVASVIFDCAHGATGEDPSKSTPADYRIRLGLVVRVLVAGLAPRT